MRTKKSSLACASFWRRATPLVTLFRQRYKRFMEINWLNLLLFCGLSLGHVALLVALVNRIHGRPLPLLFLDCIRLLHDLVMVLLPALFSWFFGINGPALFFSDSGLPNSGWHVLPVPVLAYLT